MDDEILQEFLAESWDNLGQLDTEIVSLEKEPSNAELLASIFRTIHTIKGTCGFIGLNELGGVAHSAENVLGKMRDGLLEVTPEAISLILEAIDAIKSLLEGLEATGEEPKADNSALISQLNQLADGGNEEDRFANPEPAMAPAEPAITPSTFVTPPAPLAESVVPESTAEFVASPEPVREPRAAFSGVESVPDAVADGPAGETSSKSTVADLSIRVNVDVLDSLMNLVGELVLARNQLLQLARGDDESKYATPIAHLNRVTTDLQEGVMKTRMQPIGNAWSKLPRLIRDLMQLTGRHIELEMSGAETELDRTVLDAIKGPLTHMVRNSADHGIEPPDIRSAAGKPEFGTIRLNACHEGGHVIISIEDDGAGINTKRVKQKAIENGLVSEAEAAKLSHNEIVSLIFRPGFSTAETISSISGRGVGMDVVRTQIERIGGTVDMTSIEGKGTSIRIKIPLTLAIISALVVESGGESFAIPQLGVVELVRLAAEDRHRIERIHENEVFRLRDRLLPLVHLNQVLDLPASDNEDRDINIVVVQVGDLQFGLIVSEVFDTEEIVVKPVGSLLKDVAIYQGTTILGDGRVIMILDVAGIAAQFSGQETAGHDADRQTESDTEGAVTSLLLFDCGEGSTMSVPLSLVARLEEFPRSSIEKSADTDVVQYRGDLLPILPVDGVTNSDSGPDPQPVIVFSEGEKSMGLVVNEIQDIIEEKLVIRMQSQRPGVLGTAIINGKATDVIDTQHYVIQANPEWFRKRNAGERRRVLLIDDSMFFRQLVTTSLETHHTTVVAEGSAIQAVELIERGEKFDAIVADIDLPMMDGCEFAEWLRARPATEDIPLIALTAESDSSAESRSLGAGFNRHLTKFNAQQLMDTINELCRQTHSGVSA